MNSPGRSLPFRAQVALELFTHANVEGDFRDVDLCDRDHVYRELAAECFRAADAFIAVLDGGP